MPNPLPIVLHASAAESDAGVGPTVDAAARTYTKVRLDVTAIASTLTVTVESSPTLSSWTPVGYFNAVDAVGARDLIVPNGNRYLRARWSGPATFSVTGTAYQLYVLPEDIADLGLAKSITDNYSPAEIAKACLTASSEAEGYLASANTLPITSLDDATKAHIARMALYELFRFKGTTSVQYEVGYSSALKWLGGISTGKIRPSGIVDATPDVEEAGVGSGAEMYVVSNPTRGW